MKVNVDVAVISRSVIFSVVRSVSFTVPEGSSPAEYEVFVGFDRNIPGAGSRCTGEARAAAVG